VFTLFFLYHRRTDLRRCSEDSFILHRCGKIQLFKIS
ncbi:uncharacterized, partial [Tachysurus ichikawai]